MRMILSRYQRILIAQWSVGFLILKERSGVVPFVYRARKTMESMFFKVAAAEVERGFWPINRFFHEKHHTFMLGSLLEDVESHEDYEFLNYQRNEHPAALGSRAVRHIS